MSHVIVVVLETVHAAREHMHHLGQYNSAAGTRSTRNFGQTIKLIILGPQAL